jgi:hypothetical protein
VLRAAPGDADVSWLPAVRDENMKRRILLTMLLASVLLLSACSYGYDFVVVNKSDVVIEVQYKLKRHTPETPGKFVDINPPAKLSVSEFKKSKPAWRELAKEQYNFDNATGTFTVSVAPEEVLLVEYVYNYRGDENQFDLENIRITGAKGSINLEGKQVGAAGEN